MGCRAFAVASVLVLTLSAGCTVPVIGTHATMHPSVDGQSSGAGVALGAVDIETNQPASMGTSDSSNTFVIPYSEGWMRVGLGGGQTEVRAGMPYTSVGYRWNLTRANHGGVGFALIPNVGLAYWRTSQTTTVEATGTSTSHVDGFIAFAPERAMLISFAGGHGYVAPRLGLLHTAHVAGAMTGEDTTSDYLSFGGAVGWTFGRGRPFWYTAELSFLIVDDTASGANDTGTSYYFVPTFGFHI